MDGGRRRTALGSGGAPRGAMGGESAHSDHEPGPALSPRASATTRWNADAGLRACEVGVERPGTSLWDLNRQTLGTAAGTSGRWRWIAHAVPDGRCLRLRQHKGQVLRGSGRWRMVRGPIFGGLASTGNLLVAGWLASWPGTGDAAEGITQPEATH